jgi:hypothetical protein
LKGIDKKLRVLMCSFGAYSVVRLAESRATMADCDQDDEFGHTRRYLDVGPH